MITINITSVVVQRCYAVIPQWGSVELMCPCIHLSVCLSGCSRLFFGEHLRSPQLRALHAATVHGFKSP